jgi:hypothetical protein
MEKISGEMLYYEAVKLSKREEQVKENKYDYYITLKQLMDLIDWVERNQI